MNEKYLTRLLQPAPLELYSNLRGEGEAGKGTTFYFTLPSRH